MRGVRRILVVNGQTDRCRTAFRHAISLAQTYDAALSVLHHIPDMFGLTGGPSDPPVCLNRVDGPEAEQITGWPSQSATGNLCKAIHMDKSDLVIVAYPEGESREHDLIRRECEEVIRSMPCSVLLVKGRPPEEAG